MFKVISILDKGLLPEMLSLSGQVCQLSSTVSSSREKREERKRDIERSYLEEKWTSHPFWLVLNFGVSNIHEPVEQKA
ncbi:hypothetical protein FKM82_006087 [Ascaphus truei]